MSVAPRDIDEYMAELPEDARAVLEALRRAIKAAAPDATESISYQIPTFNYRGPLVAIAAWKHHCGFYPMSKAVVAAHKDELEPVRHSRDQEHHPFSARQAAADRARQEDRQGADEGERGAREEVKTGRARQPRQVGPSLSKERIKTMAEINSDAAAITARSIVIAARLRRAARAGVQGVD